MPTHATPFIGRQAELTYDQQLLARGGVAVISGMPGVGKSALALTLAQQAAARDAIFWHACQPEEGVDAVIWRLAAFLAERGQPVLWQLLQRPLDASGRGRVAPPPLDALVDYLVQLLQQGAYVLCLDDLHYDHTHALVQKFFYNGLNRRTRQTMHRRAAAYYATEKRDALLAAQHYLRAAAPVEAAQIITANLQPLIGQGRIRALQRSLTRLRQHDLDPLLWAAVCVARGQVYALLGEWEPARAAHAPYIAEHRLKSVSDTQNLLKQVAPRYRTCFNTFPVPNADFNRRAL
ncbi:MAG: AAA family ATPase [Caldilineaceae bacterium]